MRLGRTDTERSTVREIRDEVVSVPPKVALAVVREAEHSAQPRTVSGAKARTGAAASR